MTQSPNLLIEHIAASQAQKEVTANAAFDALDKALCQLTTVALADASLSLTDTQLLGSAYLRFTGTLTAARTITVPARAKPFIVENATTGGYALNVKTSIGTTIIFNSGERKFLYGDGSDLKVVAESGQYAPYDVGGCYAGKPTASAVILRYPLPRAIRFPANMVGSKGTAGTAATAAVSFLIRKNGAQFATMDFAIGASSATFIAATATDFAAGDVLTLVAPATPDDTLADIGFALAGVRL